MDDSSGREMFWSGKNCPMLPLKEEQIMVYVVTRSVMRTNMSLLAAVPAAL
ncbi:MAG: hypothetical protein IMZ71_01675 [Chloroflexi bacterium]|nr:hypothetical protein [Chloroflexota bacterium]